MTITLHPALAQFVEDQIKAGRFQTPEDVINSALFILKGHEDEAPDSLAGLRAEIQHGLDQADRGEVEDWDADDIRAEGRRLLEAGRKESQEKAV